MKNSIKNFTNAIIAASCVYLSACGGGSDSSNKPPEVTATAAPSYYVELTAIKSLIADGKKIKFERYDVCEPKYKSGCRPAVLVYQGDTTLVYKHLTEDQDDLKISLVTLEQYAAAKSMSPLTEEPFNVVLDEVKRPLKQLNSFYLSRCRSAKEWQAMTALAAKDRRVLYVQFNPEGLRPDLLFKFDTESGAVETFKTRNRNSPSKQENPYLMLSARNEIGDLATDNALISFYKHGEKCHRIYKRIQLPTAKHSEAVDKDASSIMDYLYDNEERMSTELNVSFLGASLENALWPPYLERIYPEDQTY